MTNETTTQDPQTPAFDFESLPVSITYAGETVRDNGWKCDRWTVRISNQNGFWTTDYHTGLGLRSPIPPLYLAINPPRKGTLAYEALERASRKPVKPKVIDVLYCLFMDASAADYNFDDWCDAYGYSNDSIKALNIYKTCLETAHNLRRYFTKEQRAAIEEAVAQM